MSEKENEEDTHEAPEAKKGPSHHAYQVKEHDGGKPFFNRVGSAFAHRDGQGFNLVLDSMPVDGRVTLRSVRERPAKSASRNRDDGMER